MLGSSWCLNCLIKALWNTHAVTAALVFREKGQLARDSIAAPLVTLLIMCGHVVPITTLLQSVLLLGPTTASGQLWKAVCDLCATNTSALAILLYFCRHDKTANRAMVDVVESLLPTFVSCRSCRSLYAKEHGYFCTVLPHSSYRKYFLCFGCLPKVRIIAEELKIVLYIGEHNFHTVPVDCSPYKMELERQLRYKIGVKIMLDKDLPYSNFNRDVWACSRPYYSIVQDKAGQLYQYKTLQQIQQEWDARFDK